MTDPRYLGEFEYAVLLAVLRLKGEAAPVPIRSVIEERTGRQVARGALYTALDRLERKGCLQSSAEDGPPERGGRPRRHYRLTATGLGALRATHGALTSMAVGLEASLEQP
jgi:PadR family transcriptional regulator